MHSVSALVSDTGAVNNNDYLFTMAPVKWCDVSVLKIDVFETGKWTCKHLSDRVSIRNEPRRKCPGLKNPGFFYIMWMAGCVCTVYLGKMRGETGWQRQFDALNYVLLGNLGSFCIHVAVILYLSPTYQAHPFMAGVFF